MDQGNDGFINESYHFIAHFGGFSYGFDVLAHHMLQVLRST
jgi:hypothetical protein